MEPLMKFDLNDDLRYYRRYAGEQGDGFSLDEPDDEVEDDSDIEDEEELESDDVDEDDDTDLDD